MSEANQKRVAVGDTVSLGDFPYSAALVVALACTPYGWRIDCLRPYCLMGEDGPVVGTERVNFVNARNVTVIRRNA